MKLIERRELQVYDCIRRIKEIIEIIDGPEPLKVDTRMRLFEIKEAADQAYTAIVAHDDLKDVDRYGNDGGR